MVTHQAPLWSDDPVDWLMFADVSAEYGLRPSPARCRRVASGLLKFRKAGIVPRLARVGNRGSNHWNERWVFPERWDSTRLDVMGPSELGFQHLGLRLRWKFFCTVCRIVEVKNYLKQFSCRT